MKKLANASILIGREPNLRRLSLCITIGGTTKTVTIGSMNSVPNSISRCIPAEKKAHCGIDINADGQIFINNINGSNITYVNDQEVISKRITPDCRISLGCEQYPVDLKEILREVEKIAQSMPKEPETFYTDELEKIWNQYQLDLKTISEKQKKILREFDENYAGNNTKKKKK